MGALGRKLSTLEAGQLSFWCPGCDEMHVVGPSWTFNGNGDAPTFAPSVLVRSGHFANGGTPGNCYCDWSARFPDREPPPWKCAQCHSFVVDGRIQFLGDCTHALAGQTVELPDFPAEWA